MTPKFCSECGTQFLPDAAFCHKCGAPVGGSAARAEPSMPMSPLMRWGVPALAILALIIVVFFRVGSRTETPTATASAPMATSSGAPPDISSMSPEERADRLFNRVMTYASNGKNDSAAFFAPMAMNAIEALTPLGAHGRYDLGLVALAAGDAAKAAAQSDTILKERPTHLLGLSLAARAADARGDKAAAKAFRARLLTAEKSEKAAGLQEYKDHDADLRVALEEAAKR